MKIYILFFKKWYYNSSVILIKAVTICIFSNFFILLSANNFRIICRGKRHEREKECEIVWAPKKHKINLRFIQNKNIFLYLKQNNFSLKTNLPPYLTKHHKIKKLILKKVIFILTKHTLNKKGSILWRKQREHVNPQILRKVFTVDCWVNK